MAIEITDEMRKAVLDEMCERDGHALDFTKAIGSSKAGGHDMRNNNPNQLLHLVCRRCDRVWIVVDEPGSGYADADKKFRGRLRDGDPRKTK